MLLDFIEIFDPEYNIYKVFHFEYHVHLYTFEGAFHAICVQPYNFFHRARLEAQ